MASLAFSVALGSPMAGFLGALHPGTVHFPIALLVVAALLEIVHMVRGRSGLAATTRPLAIAAAATAVAGSIFGWLLANYDDTEGTIVVLHQWLGVAATMVACVAASASLMSNGRRWPLVLCRVALVTGAALILATGYFGGELVYGEGHLFKSFASKSPASGATGIDSSAAAARAPGDGIDFETTIAPIIRTSCLKCHGPGKVKGKLRLDVKARAMTGGEHGPDIVPGNSAKSALYTLLVSGDPEKRMPGKDDPLPAAQIDLIKKWIEQGAVWPDGFIITK